MLLDISAEMLPVAKKVIVYMVGMMTLAGMQLSIRLGHHIFKTTPWMIEFKRDNNKDNTEINSENECSKKIACKCLSKYPSRHFLLAKKKENQHKFKNCKKWAKL